MVSWMDLIDSIDLIEEIKQYRGSPKKASYKKLLKLEKQGKFSFYHFIETPGPSSKLPQVNNIFLASVFSSYKYTIYKYFIMHIVSKYIEDKYINISRKCFYYYIREILINQTNLFSKTNLFNNLYLLKSDNKLFIYLESLKNYRNLKIFKWNDFDFQNHKKIVLYDDFILRVPIPYFQYFGDYLEACRRFKYHEYLSFKNVLNSNLNIKYCLLDETKHNDELEEFAEILYCNKIQLFSVQPWGSHVEVIDININTDKSLIFKKMYNYIMHFFIHTTLYSNIIKYFKWFVRIYSYKMCYSSWYNLLPHYHYFPKSINYSLHHWFNRLLLSQIDVLAFSIDYFIIDRLKYIDCDQKLNLWGLDNYNLLSDITTVNYIRFGWLALTDYISYIYFAFLNKLNIMQWEPIPWNGYIFHWLYMTDDYNDTFDFMELPAVWDSDYLRNIFLYKRRTLDLMTWDIFRLAEANHYIYNIYELGSFNIFEIEEYIDNIYLFFFDLIIMYFHKILKYKSKLYKLSLLRFFEDLVIKIFNIINLPLKYKIYNSNLLYKILIYKFTILFNRIWLSYKKINNFVIYFWQNIEMYHDFDLMKRRRGYIPRNYKWKLLRKLSLEKVEKNIELMDIFNNMMEDRWWKLAQTRMSGKCFPSEFTLSTILINHGKGRFRRLWEKRGNLKKTRRPSKITSK